MGRNNGTRHGTPREKEGGRMTEEPCSQCGDEMDCDPIWCCMACSAENDSDNGRGIARQARTIRRWQFVANEYRALHTQLLATMASTRTLQPNYGRAWYNAYQRRKAASIKDKGRLAERARIVAALRERAGVLESRMGEHDVLSMVAAAVLREQANAIERGEL